MTLKGISVPSVLVTKGSRDPGIHCSCLWLPAVSSGAGRKQPGWEQMGTPRSARSASVEKRRNSEAPGREVTLGGALRGGIPRPPAEAAAAPSRRGAPAGPHLPAPRWRPGPARAQLRRRRGSFKWRRGRAPKFPQVVKRGRRPCGAERVGCRWSPWPSGAPPPWTTSPLSLARAAVCSAAPPAASGRPCPAASARSGSRTA